MKVLICPAHYLFTDKVGSEPMWAFQLVNSISERVEKIDVVVGICDLSGKLHPKVNLIPVFRGRSESSIAEFTKKLLFYPMLAFIYLKIKRESSYDVIHHMLPLSLVTVNPVIFIAKLFRFKGLTVLGPLQLPQELESPSDLEVVLTGTKSKSGSFFLLTYLYSLISWFAKPFSGMMFRIADVVVVNSLSSKDFYSRILKVNKLIEIPSGIVIDRTLAPQARIFSPDHSVKVLCVGQLSERKGQIYLLEAVKNLKSEGGKISLTLVGSGDQMSHYQKFVHENQLSNEVHFAGSINHSQVKEFYLSHDIFCLPSLSDPSPTVLLEAMMYGLPVIASDVGSVKEMIGTAGILVRKGSANDIKEALQYLASNSERATLMSAEGVKRVREIYDWDKIADNYLKVYSGSL